MIWDKILSYFLVFLSGGVLCTIAEILIVKTKLTPARILVIFLLSGIVLETIGVFGPLKKIFSSGVTVPITGFGASLARGAIEWARKIGFIGAFGGGLIQTAFGVGVAVVSSYLVSVIFSPKSK